MASHLASRLERVELPVEVLLFHNLFQDPETRLIIVHFACYSPRFLRSCFSTSQAFTFLRCAGTGVGTLTCFDSGRNGSHPVIYIILTVFFQLAVAGIIGYDLYLALLHPVSLFITSNVFSIAVLLTKGWHTHGIIP